MSVPTHQVRTMKSQGLDNNQIIQSLQNDGFNSSQIFEGMNQAQLQQDNKGMNMQPPKPSYPPTNSGNVSTEELVEAVIDEKWNELVKDIRTIIEWKNKAENTITALGQQFDDLKDQFDKLHQALIAKVGEYDKNILDVGAEVKAMEKVFSKVLPVFTHNVSELSKITKEMKK